MERFPGSVWTKGDRRWELRGSRATAAMGCRGGKRFGEHRWRPRKLATGSFGREEGWRRGLRGGLEGGGGGRFPQRERAEHVARAQERRRGG